MDASELRGLSSNIMILKIILMNYTAMTKLCQVELIHLMEREGIAKLNNPHYWTVVLVWSLNIIYSEQ